MGRLNIDFDISEELKIRRMASDKGKTFRELILESLEIPHEPRKVGRSTAADAKKKLEDMTQEYRLYEAEQHNETLKKFNAQDQRSKLDDAYDAYMKKLGKK